MFKVVVCSCGKSLRACEGVPELRCSVCERVHHLDSEPRRTGSEAGSEAYPNNGSKMVVFGFEPPPPRVQKAPLGYSVVEVSSEMTPPTARPVVPDRSDHKYQKKLWGPNVDLDDVPNIMRRPRAGSWALESTWYDCLAYPARAMGLIVGLGLILTICTIGLLHVVRDDAPGAWFFCLLAGVALTYGCGLLTCAITAGARGQTARLSWPGVNLKLLLESLLAGVLSFLAGPIIPAAVGVCFLLGAGELDLIDQLILFELSSAAVGYWLLVFVSLSLSEKWNALQPPRVIEQARKLGVVRTCMAVAVVLAIFHVHAWLALIGIENHRSTANFLLLFICWSSLFFWMVFLMRWLGVSVFHSCFGKLKGKPS